MDELNQPSVPDSVDNELASWQVAQPTAIVESNLRDAMRLGWAQSTMKAEPEIRQPKPRWLIVAGTLLATAASISLLAFLLAGEHSVYAQAIAAIQSARSVHAISQRFDDQGNPAPHTGEIWYDAKMGVREQSIKDGVRSFRVDNGTHQWLYRGKANTVVKGLSHDPIGVIKEALKSLQMIEKAGAKFDPTVKATAEGSDWRAFIAENRFDGGASRSICWIDRQERVMRFEQFRQGEGKWIINERIDVTYDMEIPPEQFIADFGDARLIDRTVPMQQFEAVNTIASAERLGIKIGIHEVYRLPDDAVFVMSTSRPTDEVVKRFGKINSEGAGGQSVYGEFQWGSNGRRMPDHTWKEGVQPIEVASWRRDGIEYHWTVLLRASHMLGNDDTMPIGLRLYARGKWHDFLKEQGQPWHESQALDVLKIPVPKTAESLDVILDDAYQQILTMGDQTRGGSPRLNMGLERWSEETIAKEVAGGMSEREARLMSTLLQGFTFDTSVDDWKEAVKKRIKETLAD